MPKYFAEEFYSLINRFFGFLIDDYQFVLKKKNERHYDFETATTRVSVFLEHHILVVGIEPIGEEARNLLRNNILPQQIGVSVVAQALNPNLDYEVIWNEPVLSAMERESKIVKNYCQDFLKGDFTKWTDVLTSLRRRK